MSRRPGECLWWMLLWPILIVAEAGVVVIVLLFLFWSSYRPCPTPAIIYEVGNTDLDEKSFRAFVRATATEPPAQGGIC